MFSNLRFKAKILLLNYPRVYRFILIVYNFYFIFRGFYYALINLYYCIIKRFPIKLIFCRVNIKQIPDDMKWGYASGIVIADHVKFGSGCWVMHRVTIGKKDFNDLYEKPPRIGNNVVICSNATVLGDIRIGDNVVIGACSLVIKDVPSNTVVTGIWR